MGVTAPPRTGAAMSVESAAAGPPPFEQTPAGTPGWNVIVTLPEATAPQAPDPPALGLGPPYRLFPRPRHGGSRPGPVCARIRRSGGRDTRHLELHHGTEDA